MPAISGEPMPDRQSKEPILAAAFDAAPIEAFVFDAVSLRVSMANQRFCSNLQVSPLDVIGERLHEFWPELRHTAPSGPLWALLSGDTQKMDHTAIFRRADGSYYEVQLNLLHAAGQPAQIIAQGLDLSHQRAAETATLTARASLQNAIETLPDGFVLFDKDDRLVVCNSRYRETYALSADAMTPGNNFEAIVQYGLDRGQYADAIGREQEWLAERLLWHERADQAIEQKLADGRWLRVVERKTPEGGRVGIRVDITEIKERQQLLENAAETDALTSLTNRRGVSAYLALIQSLLGANERLAVMHLDLDKFKAINDANGHEAGDFLLVTVANRLKEHARDSDIVARNGGDEFLILMRTSRTDAELLDIANRVRTDIGRPASFKGRRCQIGVSIGVALWHTDSLHPIEQVLADADTALFDGKREGRNRVALFSPQMREVTVRNAQLAQQIRVALNQDQILPHFQPQLDVTGTHVTGFEALARWDAPGRGILGGGEFLPVAEEAGLIADIDATILIKSLGFVRALTDAGFEGANVSVNISSARLSDTSLADRIIKQVAAFGLSPSQLHIEILESTLLDDRSNSIAQTIANLSNSGFRIELDDFGTGHTAIGSLRKFPVDRIKIDRSLISGIDQDHSTRLITHAIVRLAEQLEIKVLAEGVETEAERAVLEEIGCPFVQGFLFARPMGTDTLMRWLQARNLLKTHSIKPTLFDPDVARMMQARGQTAQRQTGKHKETTGKKSPSKSNKGNPGTGKSATSKTGPVKATRDPLAKGQTVKSPTERRARGGGSVSAVPNRIT